MQEILSKIPDLIQAIALIGMCLSILATIVVRITPSESDNLKVDAVIQNFMKLLSWMPTIGLNPNTKRLREAYEELKADSAKHN